MLKTNDQKLHVAVRLYENGTYGSAYGKGKFRKALFNGTVDVQELKTKYLVDFYTYEDWSNLAKSQEQMEVLANVQSNSDTLYSWIKHYDPSSQSKTPVIGMCSIDLDSLDVNLVIVDAANGVEDVWLIGAKPCKERAGLKSPQLLATNADLGNW
jgi:hypothetical protein